MQLQSSDLKQYLKVLLDAHERLYTLEQAKDKLDAEIAAMGNKTVTKEEAPDKASNNGCIWAIGAPAAGFLLGLAIGWIRSALASGRGWFVFKLLYAEESDILKGGLIGLGVGLLFGLIFLVISFAKGSRIEAQNEQNYQQALMRQERRLAQRKEVQKFREAVDGQCDSTKETLNQLYTLDVIHPTYRNMIAIASFYQYLDTGRCTTLEGHEGAYNLFENERRMDMIVYKLDQVLEQLEHIKQNQYALYAAISEANQILGKIVETNQLNLSYAKATAENSALIEYNTRSAAADLNALKWLEIMKVS